MRRINDNEGVVPIILFCLSALGAVFFPVKRRFFPTKEKRWKEAAKSIGHSSDLCIELRKRTEWDDFKLTMGMFLIYDVKDGLPSREELSVREPQKRLKHYTIAGLIYIDQEFVDFVLDGVFGPVFVKKIADSWYKSSKDDEDSFEAHLIGRLRYSEIASLRWDRNDFWEWPQVCCKYKKPRQIPFMRKFYAERIENHRGESFYIEICEFNELERLPPQLVQ